MEREESLEAREIVVSAAIEDERGRDEGEGKRRRKKKRMGDEDEEELGSTL